MMHIKLFPAHKYPWYVRLILALQRRKYGRELGPARVWGRTPRVFLGLSMLYGALDRSSSPIDPSLRSLLTVRVSQLNHCAFCVDINSSTGMKRGLTAEKLRSLHDWRASPLFTVRERAALAYADGMTASSQGVDGETMDSLKSQFNDDEIIEITALVAFQNMSSRFNSALDIPAQGFCELPRISVSR